MSLATRAAEQQQAQAGLVEELIAQLAQAWDIITLGAFATTVPEWVQAAVTLIEQFAAASGALAGDYYDVERDIARAPGTFTARLPEFEPEPAEAGLRWATQALWTPESEGPAPIAERLEAARTKSDGVAAKIVTDAARDTITGATAADPQARGWARQARASACAFCRLLVIRGAVYKEDTARFRSHDHCMCWAVPVFRGQAYDPPAHVAEWTRLYEESTADASGAEKRRAFRRALEGAGT